jgi:hypothetical protein
MATNEPAPPLIVWTDGTDEHQDDPEIVAWVQDRGAELALRPDLASVEHTDWLLRVEYRAGQIHVGTIW